MSQRLSNLDSGSLIKLSETVSGVTRAIPFLVLAHGHHAPGRTTILRQKLWPGSMSFQKPGALTNDYAGGQLDSWLTQTYLTYLDQTVQNVLANVSIRVGDGTATIDRALFLLSATELNRTTADTYTEGTGMPYVDANSRRVAYREDGTAWPHWTRSPRKNHAQYVCFIQPGGTLSALFHYLNDLYPPRPALTLPSALKVSDTADGDGCYLPSFGASVPVRVSGAWQPAEPMAKASGAWWAAAPKIKVSGAWYDAG